MFKKLLSNLPYNPSLRSDVLFYYGRLRQESGVRLIGFVFLVLALLVQASATAYHPRKTLASDPSLDGLTPATYAYCVVTATPVQGSPHDFNLTTGVYNSGLTPASYHYDIDADGSVDIIDNNTSTQDTHSVTGLANGTHTILVNVLLRSGPQYGNNIYHFTTCQTQITINEQARVELSKTVANMTQGQANADGQTANAGDQLVFKMTTQNVTGTDYQNYTGRDYIGGVLKFASVVDQNQLSNQGINLDSNGYLNWTTSNLKGNSSDVKTVAVRVKNPLPASAAGSCKISNTYGNQVMVIANCPLPAAHRISHNVNQVATKLPNTGPGSTIAIAFVVATIAGYFYSRNRIMARELEIISTNHDLMGDQSWEDR